MSTAVEDISSILSNAPAVESKPVETPVVTQEPVVRDESGKFAAKTVEAPVEKPPETKPELGRADVAAIIDERRRRQAAENRVAELERAKPKTDFFENPDEAFSERLTSSLNPLNDQIFELRMELAKSKMPDFDDVARVFLQAAATDEHLKYQADNARDPLGFIYREGMRLKELGDVGGDIGKYREKVTAQMQTQLTERDKTITQLRAELEAAKAQQSELAAIPKSLNSLSSGPAPKATDSDPEDIKSIVRFNNRRS